MEIHNHGKHLRTHIQHNSGKSAGSVEHGEAVNRSEKTQSSQLTGRLEVDSEVRERLLVEIKAKVHAGEYATRAAAEQAAQAIVE